MAAVIEVAELTTFEVTPDGERIRMHARDQNGEPATFSVSRNSVAQLMMTLPRMARQALRARYCDDSLRVVYPMRGWTIEATPGGEALILTLQTGDGFEAAFTFDKQACLQLTQALARAPVEAQAKVAAAMN